jgi:hypothetical protein
MEKTGNGTKPLPGYGKNGARRRYPPSETRRRLLGPRLPFRTGEFHGGYLRDGRNGRHFFLKEILRVLIVLNHLSMVTLGRPFSVFIRPNDSSEAVVPSHGLETSDLSLLVNEV